MTKRISWECESVAMKNKKLLKYFTEQILPILDEIEFNDTEQESVTTGQALEHLNSIYADVETVKYDVFVARDGDNFELFRLEDGRLEHRIDVDFHTVIWEVIF